MDQSYMKQKPVLPLVLSMALPMTLSMLVNSLYNIIDSIFIAKISDNAMTALSLVYPIQNLITAVTVGFGIGINAAMSFYLGAGNQKKADCAASLGVLFNALHGLLLNIICLILLRPFLSFFTDDAEILSLGVRYARITLCFSLPIGICLAFEKIFQAAGRMKISMTAMMTGCIGNIILDPFLIFGIGPFPAMGIEGAALATGIGQLLPLIVYLVSCVLRPLPVTISASCCRLDRTLIRKLYTVGIPACLNLALPSLLISALNAVLSAFSGAYVLVLGAYYKLQTFLYLTVNGVIQGMRPLIGYNYGAGEHARVKRIFLDSLLLILSVMVIGTILCIAIPGRLIGLFTENADTVALGISALRIISIGFIVSSVSVTVCGALEGLGKGVPSLVVSLMRYVVVILPASLILTRFLGASGVWHAMWVTEFITAAVSCLLYKKYIRTDMITAHQR